MKLCELFEDKGHQANKIVAILPGRFQPPHVGHLHGYLNLVNKFGAHNTYITMTDKINPENSPFSYDERKEIFNKMLGVPSDKIIKVAKQYNVTELARIMNLQDDTALVFAVSEKDVAENRFSLGKTKDGSDSYMMKYKDDFVVPFPEHSYIEEHPTTKFSFDGKILDSASQLRELFRTLSDNKKKELFEEMYGVFDERIFKVFLDRLC